MFDRLRSSLRVRLLLLAMIAMIPALALFVRSAMLEREALVTTYSETAGRLARVASDEATRQLSSTQALLAVLAQLPAVRGRSGECSEIVAGMIDSYRIYQNLGAATEGGDLFCSARAMTAPINVVDRPYFKRARQTGRFAIGDYLIGRVTGRAAVTVATPIFDGAAFRGVVFAAIDLGWFNHVIDEAALPPGSNFTVVDGAGTVLVQYPETPGAVGKQTGFEPSASLFAGSAEASIGGATYLIGFAPLFNGGNAGDVYVRVGVPKSAALAPLEDALWRQITAVMVTFALSLVVAWIGGSAFVLGRVREIVDATKRLSTGDLRARVDGPYVGELGTLAASFNDMADAIRARQEALVRSERLAALGRLSAAVGHELRNPLTVIAGRIQILERLRDSGQPPDAATVSRFIASLTEAASRMQHVVNGLSTYSKPGTGERVLLDVGTVLDATRELVAVASKAVAVDVRADGGPHLVNGVRSELMQILVNLATNAIEAMRDTGHGALTMTAARHADTIVIEVADTGPGIPAEKLSRIWDSFYTTKAEGTGLGLSIVKSLVEAWPGASIDVQSKLGAGTRFRLVLPAT